MASHIGIVGCSAEGAALCYRTICTEGADLMGPYNHPEISMHTAPFKLHVDALRAGDWRRIGELLLESATKVALLGAEFAICPDNTVHQAMPFVRPQSPIPWLHIAEEVAAQAAGAGYRRVGITGTHSLTSSELYPDALATMGIEAVRPSEEQMASIDRIILGDLVYGRFPVEARAYLMRVIDSLKDARCDAVVLGCTELPILAESGTEGGAAAIPTLDSTRILARAALRRAVGNRAPEAL